MSIPELSDSDLRGILERLDDLEEETKDLRKLIEDRRTSSESLHRLLGAHETEDAREFAKLQTQLAANTAMTESIQRLAGWSVGLLVSMVAIGLSILGLMLRR